jgi:hypothetical protein
VSVQEEIISVIFIPFLIFMEGVKVHFLRRPVIDLLYQPRKIDEYGAFGGIRIGG